MRKSFKFSLQIWEILHRVIPLLNHFSTSRIKRDSALCDWFSYLSLIFIPNAEIEWNVQVSTGNEEEASTTSNVSILLFGSKGESSEITLGLPDPNTGFTFGKGKTKIFDVSLLLSLSLLYLSIECYLCFLVCRCLLVHFKTQFASERSLLTLISS